MMKKQGKYEKTPQAQAKARAEKTILQTYVTSLISLMLCVTMFFGTTAAWFTSEVESTDNEIYVGILKVDLLKKTVDDAGEPKWETLANNDIKVLDSNIKWEPNATTIETLKVVNNEGDLAFQYRLNLIASATNTAESNTEKLSEEEIQAIASQFDVYVRNETPTQEKTTFEAAESIADLTEENGWELLGTLDQALNNEYSIFDGAMNQNDVRDKQKTEHTYSIALHMKSESTGMYKDSEGNTQTIMGKKLYLNVKLVATQTPSEADEFGTAYDTFTMVTDEDELRQAMSEGGTIVLANDIEVVKMLTIPEGVSVVLDMNGKTISVPDGSTEADPVIALNKNTSLVIDGNGTFNLNGNTGANLLWPKSGSNATITIKNGSFLRNPGDDINKYGFPFVVGETSCTLIIEGGYFDGGYYVEGDCDGICKSNLNMSTNEIVKVYGGTFVGQNPAWGDEGKAVYCPHCDADGTKCQGTFLEGQAATDTELPEGYSITEGVTEDGRPTYTVNYNK